MLVAIALYVTLAYARIPGKTSAIWLATGVQVGCLLRMPLREWPASLFAYFGLTFCSIGLSGPQSDVVAFGWPVINTGGVWLTALSLRQDTAWVSGRAEHLQSWLRFALIGGVLLPALWGICGAALLATVSNSTRSWSNLATVALGRYVNNALSIFVLVPMFLRAEQMGRLLRSGRQLEAAALLGAFGAAVALVFLQDTPLPLFVPPLLVLVLLFRLEFVGTVAGMVLLLVGVVASTLARHGPFIAMAHGDWSQGLLLGQCYLMLTFATIVLMTGLLAERQAMAQHRVELATEATRLKSQFLAKMSHEIRTPLNAILGFAELMRHDPTLPPRHLQSVQIINQSGNHLLGLINEVLDMAKVDAGQAELVTSDFDLPAFLEALISMLSLRAERKGLDLRLELAPALPPCIRADEVKLRQVCLNLVGNAVKFTERGRITLAVRFVERAPGDPCGRLHVVVSDTGPGMSAGEQEQLFTAFQQGQAGRHARGGTGLGLAISKSFVELMGGRLSVQSEVGRGSRFSFAVDVARVACGAAAESAREAIGLRPGRPAPRVLVADDVEANRILMAQLMERFGLEVRCVENGLQAVEIFGRLRPDLIWMDLVMPVMSGHTAAQLIRRLDGGAQVKIICVTADAFGGQRIDDGFDAVVLKPVSEARLVEAMRHTLGLEFVYRVAEGAGSSPQPPAGPGTIALLAGAAPAWRSEFRAAVLSGDIQRLQRHIGTLAAPDALLAQRLQTLLDQLDLAALARLGEQSQGAERSANERAASA